MHSPDHRLSRSSQAGPTQATLHMLSIASGILMELPWQNYLMDWKTSPHLKQSLPGQYGMPKHSNKPQADQHGSTWASGQLVLWQCTERGATHVYPLADALYCNNCPSHGIRPIGTLCIRSPDSWYHCCSHYWPGAMADDKHAKRSGTSVTAAKRRGK